MGRSGDRPLHQTTHNGPVGGAMAVGERTRQQARPGTTGDTNVAAPEPSIAAADQNVALSDAEMWARIPNWRNNAADWAEDCVWIERSDGSIGPIELYPEQRRALEEASRREPDPLGAGNPVHKTVVFCRPKRNNKSLDAAILAAHSIALFPRRHSYIVANSRDQAKSITFTYAADIFRFSPMLQGMARYGSVPLDAPNVELPPNATEITIPENGSIVKAVPSNWQTVQGATASSGGSTNRPTTRAGITSATGSITGRRTMRRGSPSSGSETGRSNCRRGSTITCTAINGGPAGSAS